MLMNRSRKVTSLLSSTRMTARRDRNAGSWRGFAVYLQAQVYDNAKESERDYLVCDDGLLRRDLPYGEYVQQTKG